MTTVISDIATGGPVRRTTRRVVGLIAGVVTVALVCTVGVAFALLGGLLGDDTSSFALGCGTGRPVDPLGAMPAMSELTEDQVRNAAVIIKVGQDMQVPPRGWVIGVATALQ